MLLDEQDRSRWDRRQIEEALALLDSALEERQPGPYQVQAAISALHARAERAEDNDWPQIAALYEVLYRMNPTPVVALNHASALAMAHGPERGLARLDALPGGEELADYFPYWMARAELLRRAERIPQAVDAYRQALQRAGNAVEREFAQRRLAECLNGA